MAVKAEAEQQRHHQEAGQHQAPAGIAQRRLVRRTFVRGKKHTFGRCAGGKAAQCTAWLHYAQSARGRRITIYRSIVTKRPMGAAQSRPTAAVGRHTNSRRSTRVTPMSIRITKADSTNMPAKTPATSNTP